VVLVYDAPVTYGPASITAGSKRVRLPTLRQYADELAPMASMMPVVAPLGSTLCTTPVLHLFNELCHIKTSSGVFGLWRVASLEFPCLVQLETRDWLDGPLHAKSGLARDCNGTVGTGLRQGCVQSPGLTTFRAAAVAFKRHHGHPAAGARRHGGRAPSLKSEDMSPAR